MWKTSTIKIMKHQRKKLKTLESRLSDIHSGIRTIEMPYYQKPSNWFHAISIKYPITFIAEFESTILKFIWNYKRPWIVKEVLSKKSNTGGVTISNVKLYHGAIVRKTSWYWHTKSHMDQWNTIKDLEISPHRYSHLIFGKNTKNVHWRKESLFNKWSSLEDWNKILISHIVQKLIKNVLKTLMSDMKLLVENTGEHLKI
jgi:hypothetical protein